MMSEIVKSRVLFVDDEPNILRSLVRLFRSTEYELLTASSGEQALVMLAEQTVDLVISDMRMPGLDGVSLLREIRARWPEIMRVLLTGYSDLEQTIHAINEGQIYRYLSKPWNDTELLLVARQALEQKRLQQENQRLQRLAMKQNDMLKNSNAKLEIQVRQRTAELQQLVSFMELTQHELKESYHAAIEVFSSLMEMRSELWSGHGRRVAHLVQNMLEHLPHDEQEKEAMVHAALLHDIGKLSLSDELLVKPTTIMNRQELKEWMLHPQNSEMALLPITQLQAIGGMIRHHHERFDGAGFPDKLKGFEISLGARILAIVNDYDELMMGLIQPSKMDDRQACSYIKKHSGMRYDPDLVDIFMTMSREPVKKSLEYIVKSDELAVGMVLSRDLLSHSRYLLLTNGRRLDDTLIKHIRRFEEVNGHPLTIHVLREC